MMIILYKLCWNCIKIAICQHKHTLANAYCIYMLSCSFSSMILHFLYFLQRNLLLHYAISLSVRFSKDVLSESSALCFSLTIYNQNRNEIGASKTNLLASKVSSSELSLTVYRCGKPSWMGPAHLRSLMMLGGSSQDSGDQEHQSQTTSFNKWRPCPPSRAQG